MVKHGIDWGLEVLEFEKNNNLIWCSACREADGVWRQDQAPTREPSTNRGQRWWTGKAAEERNRVEGMSKTNCKGITWTV